MIPICENARCISPLVISPDLSSSMIWKARLMETLDFLIALKSLKTESSSLVLDMAPALLIFFMNSLYVISSLPSTSNSMKRRSSYAGVILKLRSLSKSPNYFLATLPLPSLSNFLNNFIRDVLFSLRYLINLYKTSTYER